MAVNLRSRRSAMLTMLTLLVISGLVIALLSLSKPVYDSGDQLVLHGASEFDHNHSYTKALVKFTELFDEYYQGPLDVKFVIHANGELGSEGEYFAYMNIGAVVDFAILAPSHASPFSSLITIMDIPFLFEDADHYLASIDANVFAPIEHDVLQRADIMILGYGGGEKRHIFGRRPVRNMEELKGFDMRVMGSPIQTRMFEALGATPTVISFAELYNALQTGVVSGAENSVAIIELQKLYEVAPEVSVSAVSYIVRPLFFNAKRFRLFPPDVRDVIKRAGREAMAFERSIEMGQDDPTMRRLEKEGKINVHFFRDRDQLLKLAEPVKEAFAHKIGADSILETINELATSRIPHEKIEK